MHEIHSCGTTGAYTRFFVERGVRVGSETVNL